MLEEMKKVFEEMQQTCPYTGPKVYGSPWAHHYTAHQIMAEAYREAKDYGAAAALEAVINEKFSPILLQKKRIRRLVYNEADWFANKPELPTA